MSNVTINLAEVIRVESIKDADNANGLRIKANLNPNDKSCEKEIDKLPWYFPLLPKTFQSVPREGECVLIIFTDGDKKQTQGYYIGPIISQPQYQTNCNYTNATSLLKNSKVQPIRALSNDSATNGSFPSSEDVAVVGRGREDIILKYDQTSKVSEVDIRAGIRGDLDNESIINGASPVIGHNVIFNGVDPAYIQLKYKAGISTGNKKEANSLINIVADRINIMSNRDTNVNHNIHDNKTLVNEKEISKTMDSLHQVPKGDKLVELLEVMKGAIMHHVHPWAGMEQCGDWPGYIKKLDGYDIKSILSEYVRIS